jgi:apolipoprotein N-acyltransferase
VKTYQFYLLALISGLLLTFGWFPNGLVPLLFVAFVPLLIVEHNVFKDPQQFKKLLLFSCSFLTFFTWNVLTTWWVKNASFGGAAMAIICNSLLMTTVFLLFHKVKKRLGKKWGIPVFISFWITFEFFHLDWDLTWPWLNLGNAFADNLNWIQWYEYTGTFGGTLWILLVNSLVFLAIHNTLLLRRGDGDEVKQKIIAAIALLILPIIISLLMIPKIKEPNGKKLNVVIVQPNIDPYNVKFIVGFEEQLQKMLLMAAEKTDSTTDYLVFPETALTENLWEDQLQQSTSVGMLKQFLKSYPQLKIIIGAATAKVYKQGEALSSTARKFTDANEYYDAFNTALQIDSTAVIQIYHKSRLVPGVEKMPFPFIFKHLESIAIDLGGTTGSLGTQEERSVLISSDNTIKTAPVICYESIYGEYVSDYIKNGAQFISIITNDGWWGDTPGYQQLLKYGALRAIENRRYVARAANLGVACIINHKGEILQPSKWNTPVVFKGEVVLNDELTFYTRFGDYIARFAMYLSVFLIVYSWLLSFKGIKKRVNS